MKILLKPKSQKLDVKYDLTEVISILKLAGNKKSFESKKIKMSDLDQFLFSGRLNTVIGLKGIQNFKNEFTDVLNKVNNESFDLNHLSLNEVRQWLLSSGLYYSEKKQTFNLKPFNKNSKYLTAYRFIIKNFKDISFKDFNTIAQRLNELQGQLFYINSNDSSELKSIASTQELFEEKTDTLTYLKQLPIKQLKTICEHVKIQPARNAEETSNKIYKFIGERSLDLIPQEFLNRKNIVFKNQSLLTGQDFIDLNLFLENTAKNLKEDLVKYIKSIKSNKFFE